MWRGEKRKGNTSRRHGREEDKKENVGEIRRGSKNTRKQAIEMEDRVTVTTL